MGEKPKDGDRLLRRSRAASRALALVAAWTKVGVSASSLSVKRQAELIGRFRAARLRRSPEMPAISVQALADIVREFARRFGVMVIVGWNIDEDPALLVSTAAILRSLSHLPTLYSDGVLLLDQAMTAALVVDFEDRDYFAVCVALSRGTRPRAPRGGH